MIRLEKVSKLFGEIHAIHDLDLHVPRVLDADYLQEPAETAPGDGVLDRAAGRLGHVLAVQVRDASNRYHSLDKADLRAFRKLEDQSLMPNFRGSLSDSDLADLVAYLASLRGAE